MSSDRLRQRLLDIVDNLDAVESYTGGMDFAAFSADRRTVDAVERCIERAIEAVVKIGDVAMAGIAPDIPFERVRGLGNVLRHEYDRIDLRSLFTLVRNELPVLRDACAGALRVVDRDGAGSFA